VRAGAVRATIGRMSSPRRLPVLAVLLLLPVLAGCGDDEPEDAPPSSSSPSSPGGESTAEDSTATSEATSEATTDATTEAAGLPPACEVMTSDDLAAAFGVQFGPAEPGGGGHTEQDVEWQSDNCDWEAEDLVEVQLALTGPDDFTGDDAFTCPEPSSIAATVEPVEGVGDRAYWKRDEAPPLEATLRVCTASYNFDIDLDYEDGVDFEGDPQQQSIALARVVLAKLG
jgi:predicted small lipoprotein YifL